jgi:hypothetical protein
MVTGNGRPFCPGKVKIQEDPVAKHKIPIKSYLKTIRLNSENPGSWMDFFSPKSLTSG